MISSKEALELVLASEKNMQLHLDKISEMITHSANRGKRTLFLNYDKIFEPVKQPYRAPELTGFQYKLKQKLEAYGYSLKIDSVSVDTHINNDGNPLGYDIQKVTKHILVVSW